MALAGQVAISFQYTRVSAGGRWTSLTGRFQEKVARSVAVLHALANAMLTGCRNNQEVGLCAGGAGASGWQPFASAKGSRERLWLILCLCLQPYVCIKHPSQPNPGLTNLK
jgi:hypothetical protein